MRFVSAFLLALAAAPLGARSEGQRVVLSAPELFTPGPAYSSSYTALTTSCAP